MDHRLEAFSDVVAKEEGYKSALDALLAYLKYVECNFINMSHTSGDLLPMTVSFQLRPMIEHTSQLIDYVAHTRRERYREICAHVRAIPSEPSSDPTFHTPMSLSDKTDYQTVCEQMSPLTLPTPVASPVASCEKLSIKKPDDACWLNEMETIPPDGIIHCGYCDAQQTITHLSWSELFCKGCRRLVQMNTYYSIRNAL